MRYKRWLILFCLLFLAMGSPVLLAQTNATANLVIATPTPDCSKETKGCGSTQTDSAPVQGPAPQVQLAARRSYAVQAGDTLLNAALELGMDIEEVGCLIAPDFQLSQPLVIGDIITVLPPEERCHQVQAGESIESIAAQYDVLPAAILIEPWNRFAKDQPVSRLLPVGRYVHVWTPVCPLSDRTCQAQIQNARSNIASGGLRDGGTTDGGSTQATANLPTFTHFIPWMLEQPIGTSPTRALEQRGPTALSLAQPVPIDWPYGSGHFAWPIYGWLTQGYRSDHRAVDIAAPLGTAITASDRGVVYRAGWNNQGYGNMVIIDHKIDYMTLYAHLSKILVKEGDIVAQGQVIGLVGSTGNSTGAHLHFEIRDFGRLTNPIELLGR